MQKTYAPTSNPNLNVPMTEQQWEIVDFIDDMNNSSIAAKIVSYDNHKKGNILNVTAVEQHLHKFSWEVCARKYIELYTHLLGI